MVCEDLRISRILTREAFENAIRANAAMGGSTNAVIHLLAIAGRVGVPLTLEDWDCLGRDCPTLVNLMPSGQYLMEDFYYAGGLPAVIRALGEHGLLRRDALTVNGKTIWENCREAPNWNTEVIRTWDRPLLEQGGIAVLRGNLAPGWCGDQAFGCVAAPDAASRAAPSYSRTSSTTSSESTSPDLNIDENSVLVLKNCGPKGYPGMAEVGNMGLAARSC